MVGIEYKDKHKHKYIMKLLIYVLCYNQHSYNVASNEYGNKEGYKIVYINSTNLLENIMYDSWLLDHQDEWKEYDYVGTISWKASQKCHMPDLNTLKKNLQIYNPDIVPFFCFEANLVEMSRCHPNFEYLWVKTLSQLGFSDEDALNPDILPFMSNYWITKPVLMYEYIEFFKKTKQVLDNYKEIQEKLWEDSKYYHHTLSVEKCLELFNKPYYTHHPFIYERIPCFFFWYKKCKFMSANQ
jgi:hypothetical protein